MGDACPRGLMYRHLLPDVSSCCFSWNASTGVAQAGLIVDYRDLPPSPVFFKLLGLATPKKSNTDLTPIYSTKFGIVTFILKSARQYPCWWPFCPRGYDQLS